MPAKRRTTSAKAKGSSAVTASSDGPNKHAAVKSPPRSMSGKKKATSPPIHASRETVTVGTGTAKNGKGDFLGKGGVLTLNRADGGGKGSRGRSGTSGRGVIGSSRSSAQGRTTAVAAKRTVLRTSGRAAPAGAEADSDGSSASGQEDQEDDEDSEGGDEVFETKKSRGKDVEGRVKICTGSKSAAATSSRRGSQRGGHEKEKKGDEEEEGEASEGEESEQELQSFMEAFPGMSSDDEGEEGLELGEDGRKGDSSGAESDSQGEDDDDEQEDEQDGLMEVSSLVHVSQSPGIIRMILVHTDSCLLW